MSSFKEPSIADIDQASEQITLLMNKRTDLEDQLKPLRKHLIEMRVALSELEELRDEADRGDITEDAHHVRRKKLKKAYLMARENITDAAIGKLIDEVKDQGEKSRLQRFKDCIRSNKDTILFLIEVGSTLVKAATGK